MHVLFFIFSYLFFGCNAISITTTTTTDSIDSCNTVDDCTKLEKYNSWCDSAVLCLDNYCRKIEEIPCKHTQICLEDTKECIDVTCKNDEECNDGVYCNGLETCDKNKGVCVLGKDNCNHGICSEINKKCQWPIKINEWKTQLPQNDNLIVVKSIVDTKDIIKVSNVSDPIFDLNDPVVQITVLIFLIVSLLCAFGACAFVAFGVGRPQVIVHGGRSASQF